MTDIPPLDQLVSIREAARRAGVSHPTLLRRIASGDLRCYDIVGVKRVDIREVLRVTEVFPRPAPPDHCPLHCGGFIAPGVCRGHCDGDGVVCAPDYDPRT